jgi:hypothetical protein
LVSSATIKAKTLLALDFAPLAAKLPRLMNLVTQTPGLPTIAKLVGGVARERDMPRFAAHTFRLLHH